MPINQFQFITQISNYNWLQTIIVIVRFFYFPTIFVDVIQKSINFRFPPTVATLIIGDIKVSLYISY